MIWNDAAKSSRSSQLFQYLCSSPPTGTISFEFARLTKKKIIIIKYILISNIYYKSALKIKKYLINALDFALFTEIIKKII